MAKKKPIDPMQAFKTAMGAENIPLTAAAADKDSYLSRLFRQLYQSDASTAKMADMFANSKGISADDFVAAQGDFLQNPLNVQKTALGEGRASGMGNTLRLLGANIKAHPWASAGTAINAGGNVAGLFDNNKLLGQAIGTAAGVAIPSVLGMNLSPLAAANVAMGAGNIGALFDTLRSKKEENEYLAQLPAEYTTY